MKVFVSWSGGKDCMLACYRIMQQPKIEVACLLNMLAENGECSLSHNLPANLLQEQGRKMKTLPHVDACGEKGEYHTFVYDGPIFKSPVVVRESEQLSIEKHWVSKLELGSLA